jgi:hypothetical protein
MLNQLTKSGIRTQGELTQAFEHEVESITNKIMRVVLESFPKALISISKSFNEDVNDEINGLKYIQIYSFMRKDVYVITTKEFQNILKKALKRVESTNFNKRLNIDNFDPTNILTFQQNCKNVKLRNIYFRLIHRDFFTHVRMKKYKMTDTDKCPRCFESETITHLLWECHHVKKIWELYNSFMIKWGNKEEQVQSYENIYSVGRKPGTTLIKIRIIQELIQMERPKNWSINNLETIVENIIKTKQQIANKNYVISSFHSFKFSI